MPRRHDAWPSSRAFPGGVPWRADTPIAGKRTYRRPRIGPVPGNRTLIPGRLLLNVVTGGDAAEQRAFGDWLDHDQRYQRADEFLLVLRGAWGDEPLIFHGEHYRVEGASAAPAPDPLPRIYFGGASPAAERVAARHADVYLLWGETPEMVAERLERMRRLAAGHGRELRFGLRLQVIARDDEGQAWAQARSLLDRMDARSIEEAQARLNASESVGQRRMASLHDGRTDRLEVAPNLWAGFGLVRGGAGTGLVGDHGQVAERIQQYHELGVDEFILSGYPHLEEAYWFGEGVIPILRRRGLLDGPEARVAAGQHGGLAGAARG